MRQVHIITGTCAALVIAGFAFDYGKTSRDVVLPVELPAGAAIEHENDGESNSHEPELVHPPNAPPGAREDVPAPPIEAPTAEDSNASILSELAAARATIQDLEGTIAQLRKQLAEVSLERDSLKFPEDTPYGAFLASDEAAAITDPRVRARIKDWLRQFPVILRPGEATWISNRNIHDDWGKHGATSEIALILFLGPDRLVAELPPARVAVLRTYYAGRGVFN